MESWNAELNGRRCLKCGHTFASSDAIEREFSTWLGVGEHLTQVRQTFEHCCECDSVNLEPVALCDQCWIGEPVEGLDVCLACVPPEDCDYHKREWI